MILQQFVERGSKGELAQNKAMFDVAAALDDMGFERVVISRKMRSSFLGNSWERICWVLKCLVYRRRIRPNAVVALQYTITCWHGALAYRLLDEEFKARRNLKIIALVHDINRGDVLEDRLTDHEKRFFKLCDKILVHCENMRQFFVKHGVDAEKLEIFEAFDYLMDHPIRGEIQDDLSVVNCCGNLSPHKCGCYRELKSLPFVQWRLYGPNCSADYLSERVRQMGVCPPDELPDRLETGFGLIWDGDSIETQTGLFGAYQKYNHPHKLSLYLASGLPLILWDRSGAADFVVREGVGFVVSSLREIPDRLRVLTPEDYRCMRQKAIVLGNRLRTGCLVRQAIERCLGDALRLGASVIK